MFLAENIIRIIGKGDKERIVPMSSKDIDHINQYIIKERSIICKRSTSNGYLFLNNRGNQISRVSIWKILKKYCVKSGINKDVSPHTLLHTFATHLLDNGADLMALKDLLGHASLSSTQLYTHVQIKKLKDAYNQAHPHAK